MFLCVKIAGKHAVYTYTFNKTADDVNGISVTGVHKYG